MNQRTYQTTKNDSCIRIGRIDYANVWPIFYHFDPEGTKAKIEMIPAVPSTLNQAMREGKIDMGPISAFAYGVSSDDYVLFPDLSVSALGRVNSLMLFVKKPLHEVMDGSIALTTTSATTINLLKIIAAKQYRKSPTYLPMEPDLEAMMAVADGALLIGDHAIRAYWANEQDPKYEVYDLGEMWYDWTGRWMTFAVWAVRKEAILKHSQDISLIVDAFRTSKMLSNANPEPLVRDAVHQLGGTADYWRHYFNNLNYDFGPEQQQGLQLYFEYAYELGLIDHEVRLDIWSENTVG
ncbi:menaquinone biosynthetic enzyme MqnA/MqnD family protein [Paenibacillus marinisediminis]